MTRLPLGLLLVAIAGCPAPAERHSEAATVASVAPSSLPLSRDVDAAPPPQAPPRARFPVPATPHGANAEHVLFASSICAAAYTANGAVGCRNHPPFDVPEREPDGKLLLHAGDPLTFCRINAIHHGAFTKPGATQAIVSFDQCKDNDPNDVWDSGFPGSAVLVEQIGGDWQPIAYEHSVNAGVCQKAHRKDGRDVLLCTSNFSAGSIGTMHYVVLVDFAGGADVAHAHTVATIFSNVDLFRCFDVASPDPVAAEGLVGVHIDKVSLADVNGDGTPDLLVDVDRARAAPSASLEPKVRAVCKQNGASFSGLLPRGTKTRLVIASDGDAFRPTPETRALLDRWESESTYVTQLKGAAPPALP